MSQSAEATRSRKILAENPLPLPLAGAMTAMSRFLANKDYINFDGSSYVRVLGEHFCFQGQASPRD
jgi:hypothetical protein